MKLREALARNLRRLRAEKRISQERLALDAGIDRSYVSLLETEKYSASIDMVEKLGKVLRVDPVSLLAAPKKPARRSK